MVRFAASPTDDMHIEELRMALLSYLVAQKQQDSFLVRIDDLDTTNTVEGKDTEIMEILRKFALKHDMVHHQSEYLHMYHMLALQLLKEKKAFICTCPTNKNFTNKLSLPKTSKDQGCCGECIEADPVQIEEIKASKTPFVVRLKKPDRKLTVKDLILKEISILPQTDESLDDTLVILDEAGMPTHTFASACDDMLNGTSMVINTAESLENTQKEILIKEQLGYPEACTYAHVPSLCNLQDKKEANTLLRLLQEGFIPDAIINYLVLLSYREAPEEIFTLPEALDWFDPFKLSKTASKFNIDTLRFINKKHLERMEDKKLSTLFGFADADIGTLAKLYLNEACTINELEMRIKSIFGPKIFDGQYANEIETLRRIIEDAPMIDGYEAFVDYLVTRSGLNKEAIKMPLRLLLTGAKQGPKLSEIYPYLKPYLLEVIT